jgi:hypothetical protein
MPMIQLDSAPTTPAPQRSSQWPWLGLLMAYMFLVGLYFVGRFAGRWAEGDSTTFTLMIKAFAQDGQLIPGNDMVYPNGFAYQAISTFVVAMTGLEPSTLQQHVYPLLACIVVLPAWILYRELTGSAMGATLTTALLLSQPEFLFVVLRSSHEKFSRTFLLLCLFLLARSFNLRNRPWMLAAHVGLFYLVTLAFITTNNLLAHSFIFAVAVALLLGWLVERRNKSAPERNTYILQRLFYATLICFGIAYLCMFAIYPPAQHDLFVLQNIWERVAALLLDVQTKSTNAYAQVATGWISVQIYFLVSIANWIVLAISFAIWIHQAYRWLWKGEAPASQGTWLLWLFYAAFAFQGVLSALADASGALGSNLQHRLFPSFSLIAVALVGTALAKWRPRRLRVPIWSGLSIGIFCIAILSVMKATNEPLLSNKWTFYRPSELAALKWEDGHLKSAPIWVEYDERLAVAYRTVEGESAHQNHLQGDGEMRPSTRNMVVSSVTRLRAVRLGLPLPIPPDAFQVYDNGEAQIYHLRPATPYQP